jgi:hypothetical protein
MPDPENKQNLSRSPQQLNDPDLLNLLQLISAFLIAIVTTYVQVHASDKRNERVDRRDIEKHILEIRDELKKAQYVLGNVDKLIKVRNIYRNNIWSDRGNNIDLTPDESRFYLNQLDLLLQALKQIDEECMSLASLSSPSNHKQELMAELNILQSLLPKILTATTYREKITGLRRGIGVSENLFDIAERDFRMESNPI